MTGHRRAGHSRFMADPVHTLALTVVGLAAQRGGTVVADGVSFSLLPGQAVTLRGPNGAGKTSILRAIAGFARSPSGAIAFQQDGANVDSAEVRATHLHYLGDGDGLADRLTVTETAQFWAGLYGASGPSALAALDQAGLQDLDHRPVGKLSTGQRRRLGLMRLALAPRALWLLDEPFSGLDDTARGAVRTQITRHREGGGIVVMASHEDGLDAAPVLRLSRPERRAS